MNSKKGFAFLLSSLLISVCITSSVSAYSEAEMKSMMSKSFNLDRSDYESDPIETIPNFMPNGLVALKVDHGSLGGIMLANDNGFIKGYTWGSNGWGQIGVGKDDAHTPSKNATTLTNTQSQSLSYSGGLTELTFFTDQNVRDSLYQKFGTEYNISVGERLTQDVELLDVDAGYHHFVALDENHDVWAWGKNTDYEIGRRGETKYSFPQHVSLPLEAGDQVIKVYGHNGALDRGQSFAVTENGKLYSWGSNTNGLHGAGSKSITADYQSTPSLVSFADSVKIVDVQGGDYHNAALDEDGNVYTWGLSTYLGQDTKDSSNVPIPLTGDTNAPWTEEIGVKISRISVSYANTLLLDSNGEVWQFGGIYVGPTSGHLTVLKTPQKVEIEEHEAIRVAASYNNEAPRIVEIEAGESVSYMIDDKGRSWAWGDNRYSGLGREGAYAESKKLIIKKAYQFPQVIGDGDTQTSRTDAKLPIGLTAPEAPNPKAQDKDYGTFGFNSIHPTIYDNRYAEAQDNAAMAFWKEHALKQVPKIKSIQASRSAYSIIDFNGNVYIWSYDGSASVAWGWDYDSTFDKTGNIRDGMYDKYLYEVTPFGASGSSLPN